MTTVARNWRATGYGTRLGEKMQRPVSNNSILIVLAVHGVLFSAKAFGMQYRFMVLSCHSPCLWAPVAVQLFLTSCMVGEINRLWRQLANPEAATALW